MLNRWASPIDDYLKHKPLKLHVTLEPQDAYGGADFVIIATPTDYDLEINYFNTS